jgi:hypothetical protein
MQNEQTQERKAQPDRDRKTTVLDVLAKAVHDQGKVKTKIGKMVVEATRPRKRRYVQGDWR